MGRIFQSFNLIGDLTVAQNVELPLTYRGMPAPERHNRVETARPLSKPALRRPAAACCSGASGSGRPFHPARRRADRQSRFTKRRSGDEADGRAARGGLDDLHGHARPSVRAPCAACREFAYAERFAHPAGEALFPVEYRVPATLRATLRGKRVAIVNDVTSAGSAVRGTFLNLQALGSEVVAIASPLALGGAIGAFGRERGIAIEALQDLPRNQWIPAECPLCE